MRFSKILSSVAVLAFLGTACGQLDENGRAVVYDTRDAGPATVVLVVRADITVPEEVIEQIARTIRIEDSCVNPNVVDVRNGLDPTGPLWIDLERGPDMIAWVPVLPPRTSADYRKLMELLDDYPMLEIVAREPSLAPDGRLP